MKKVLLLLSLFLLPAIFAFAQEVNQKTSQEEVLFTEENLAAENNQDIIVQINSLIAEDFFSNQNQIKSLSSSLTFEERSLIYNTVLQDNEEKVRQTKLLNFFVGYGVGSFRQGDRQAFVPLLITDIISSVAFYGAGSVALVYWGANVFSNLLAMMVSPAGGTPYVWEWAYVTEMKVLSVIACVGLTGLLTTRILSLILPENYSEKFNASLLDSLNLNDSLESISIRPFVIPSQKPGLGLAFCLNFKN